MAKHIKLVGVTCAILAALGGVAMASNMGFKFVPNLNQGDPKIFDISVPDNNNYTSTKAIFDDISASAGCSAASVITFDVDQNACTWLGLPGGCVTTGFNTTQKGIGVRVSTNGPCTGWVIVGSHDPTLAHAFTLTDPKIYDFSLAYHTTRTTTKALFDEIGVAASVTGFDPDQTACTWLGLPGGCVEPITIGKSYFVTVGSPVNYIESHY